MKADIQLEYRIIEHGCSGCHSSLCQCDCHSFCTNVKISLYVGDTLLSFILSISEVERKMPGHTAKRENGVFSICCSSLHFESVTSCLFSWLRCQNLDVMPRYHRKVKLVAPFAISGFL